MKAAVYNTYGPPEVVHIGEVAKPIPAPNEVLVKIVASTISAGAFTPVIDRMFPLENIVEAHAYVDQGHKCGSVIINIAL